MVWISIVSYVLVQLATSTTTTTTSVSKPVATMTACASTGPRNTWSSAMHHATGRRSRLQRDRRWHPKVVVSERGLGTNEGIRSSLQDAWRFVEDVLIQTSRCLVTLPHLQLN